MGDDIRVLELRGDRLGEVLLKAGKINVKQFDMATKVMSHAKKRLGGILVELGYLKPKDLFWGVKYQVQEIVASLFDMTEGRYEFIPGEIPPGEVITLHMSTANLIMQGIRDRRLDTHLAGSAADGDGAKADLGPAEALPGR